MLQTNPLGMTLSVIIVNFNVKYFVLQCLQSVYNALGRLDAEVFVVDNASSDGSCPAIRERFGQVRLIENRENVGFAKANNQAINCATGEYILLLNPDTVVQESTFRQCIDFMESHPDAGGLTVKMIDGKGNYLPESKRGFPSPWVAFCKIVGLTALFPHSKRLARYYLGHLDKNLTHAIDVLPGAFMFMRRAALDRTGLLDENFFMYGEDIDLSYRITQNGFKNYYLPDCQIIHYKGESTKKGSLNYVVLFYRAMILFAKKHLRKNSGGLILLINLAIYFRAFLAILKRAAHAVWLPLSDILLSALGFIFLIPAWQMLRFQTPDTYPRNYVLLLVSAYVLIWTFSLWMMGAYDRPQKKIAASKGIAAGTLVILAFYSVLPVQMRFSRAIILLGSVLALIATQGARLIYSTFVKNLFIRKNSTKRTAIIAHNAEATRVSTLLKHIGMPISQIVVCNPGEMMDEHKQMNINALTDYIELHHITELIFCPLDLPMSSIIHTMLMLSPLDLEFKLAPNDSAAIIGSNSVNTQGELYTLDFKSIGTPMNRRQKRLFDITSALLIVLTWPAWLFVNKHPLRLLGNALTVMLGKKTWIGYAKQNIGNNLPKIKKGIYNFSINYKNNIEQKCEKEKTKPINVNNCNTDIYQNINFLDDIDVYYAKNYKLSMDTKCLWYKIIHEQ